VRPAVSSSCAATPDGGAELELRLHRLERRIAAVERHPAGLAQIFHFASDFGEQRFVLGDRAAHQWDAA